MLSRNAGFAVPTAAQLSAFSKGRIGVCFGFATAISISMERRRSDGRPVLAMVHRRQPISSPLQPLSQWTRRSAIPPHRDAMESAARAENCYISGGIRRILLRIAIAICGFCAVFSRSTIIAAGSTTCSRFP